MTSRISQLPLALRLEQQASFDSFVDEAGAGVIEHVRGVARGERRESVWIWGAPGTGKSHLLAAACREAATTGLRAIYIALNSSEDTGLLSELDSMSLIALDDVHLVAGIAEWERALFRVFDSRLETGGLIAAAAHAPRECGFVLDDLKSRAQAAGVHRLPRLDDTGLAEAISRHAAKRGLDLDDAARNYLLRRLSREIADITSWLDRVDAYALAAQRRITVPLLRELMES